MATIAEAMAIAFNYHQRGDLAQAEKIYRQMVEAEPEHADAWHLLGVAAQQTGRPTEAATAIARAVAINGSNPHLSQPPGRGLRVGRRWPIWPRASPSPRVGAATRPTHRRTTTWPRC